MSDNGNPHTKTIFDKPAFGAERGPLNTDDLDTRTRLKQAAGKVSVVDGHGAGNSWEIVFTIVSIGRGVRNDVRLDFGDQTIHRDPHAAIETDGQRFRVHDVRRGNPVFVNDAIVDQPRMVTFGDRIRVGATTLRLDPA